MHVHVLLIAWSAASFHGGYLNSAPLHISRIPCVALAYAHCLLQRADAVNSTGPSWEIPVHALPCYLTPLSPARARAIRPYGPF